ncbi:hypothetical protein KDA_70090 [Dictyobacter alpinus]|uniref:Uncharacterized protein n=1 Tax=Dictyobacter alpinus TaxID=2014873 RepID=A0A402BJK7_9CHLR|nr:hypothetical protein [Dictyobacter alpinus]GCE31525.1 hypothetical protein KDA_70090 [Dictyobacter alpinus]
MNVPYHPDQEFFEMAFFLGQNHAYDHVESQPLRCVISIGANFTGDRPEAFYRQLQASYMAGYEGCALVPAQ